MQKIIPDILTFLHRANELKTVMRYKSSLRKHGDTVADHSWRLTLMALVIGTEFEVPVDVFHAMKIALVHDLAEMKTDDIDAYEVIKKRVALEDKKQKELEAMHEILQGIAFGQDIFAIWKEYEDQQTIEAKFVKALDKIEAFLHLDETGTEVYFPEEFHGDYADAAVRAFDEAMHHFPPLVQLLDPIKKELKKKFEALGVEWVEGQI